MKQFLAILLAIGLLPIGALSALADSGPKPLRPNATTDDLIFIHHSCGQNWLDNSLHVALLAKDYIDERNDIYYGTDISPDSGRPDSLAPTPGNQTDMNHWVPWFNDYFSGIKIHGAADGYNRIIMFKSCYPNSNISSDGAEPGDPFSSAKTLANYKAVYRHPDGPGHTYPRGGYAYQPLEDIFAAHPEILFIPVTAPPRHYAPSDATNNAEAHRARTFNNWLKYDWLASYNAAHPNLHNVAVFDWFNVLTYPDTHPVHPNRLRQEYGGDSGNSHPNHDANHHSTDVFASNTTNFIDNAWSVYNGGNTLFLPSITIARLNATDLRVSWSHDWDVSWYRVWRGTDPYFTPSGPTPRALIDAAPWQYDDVGALGGVGANYFYLVEDVLSDGVLSVARRVGEFDFALIPGEG